MALNYVFVLQLYFTTEKGLDPQGHIGIDDISIIDGKCFGSKYVD